MYDIVIDKPIGLKMKVIEIDTYVPSFKVSTIIEITHPTGFFKYHADDIWFERSKWDSFCSNLLGYEAVLEDMSDYFKFSVEHTDTHFYLIKLSCYEPNIGNGETLIHFSISIDADVFTHIRKSFTSFSLDSCTL